MSQSGTLCPAAVQRPPSQKVTLRIPTGDLTTVSRFRVDDREPLECGNLAEDLVRCNEVIQQCLAPQRKRQRNLQSLQCPKPPVKSVAFDQALCRGEFAFSHGVHCERPRDDILAELPEKNAGVVPTDELSTDLDRKDRWQFDDG